MPLGWQGFITAGFVIRREWRDYLAELNEQRSGLCAICRQHRRMLW